jgi:hypothetical protein
VGGGDRLGLRRAALPQEDPEHDQGADRQELALPVLHGLEPELRAGHEPEQREGCLAVLDLLLVVLGVTTQGVQQERQQEQRRQRQRQ